MQFKTSDIVLASCLKMNNCKLENIQVDATGRGTFVFTSVEDSLIQEFDLGNMLVDPVAFNNTIKQLTTAVRRLSVK